MDEIAAIEAITSAEQLKPKRGTRRGLITKLQKKVTLLLTEDLHRLSKSELSHTVSESRRQAELETAIQSQIEFLLESDPASLKTEQEDGERFDPVKSKLLKEAETALEVYEAFCVLNDLAPTVEPLLSVTNVDTPTFRADVKDLLATVSSLRRNYPAAIADPRLAPTMHDVTKAIDKVKANMYAHASGPTPVESSLSTPAASSVVMSHESSLKIDLPKFDGKSVNWHAFRHMFENVLDKRGKSLSGVEKVTLLIHSLNDPDAKDYARQHSETGSNFSTAMEALQEKYGSIKVVYPDLVSTIRSPYSFDYSVKGFKDIQKHLIEPFNHMKSIKETQLSTYLAVSARSIFTPKLKEEWDRFAETLDKLPCVEDISTFIKRKSLILSAESKDSPSNHIEIPHTTRPSSPTHFNKSKTPRTLKCPICADKHLATRCTAFSDMDVERRNKIIRDKRLCINCLGEGHQVRACPSKFTCRHCKQRHHSMLHRDRNEDATSRNTTPALLHIKDVDKGGDTDFIETALVTARSDSRHAKARVVLDSGACASFVSEQLASHLHLPRQPANKSFSSADGEFACKHKVTINITPTDDETTVVTAECFVIPKLPEAVPPDNHRQIMERLDTQNLHLADPELGGAVDIILGNRTRRQCVISKSHDYEPLKLGLTKTLFGWTVSGPLTTAARTPALVVQSKDEELDEALQRLWELEKVEYKPKMSPEDERAVQEFDSTHQVAEDGRYIVRLPKKQVVPELGDSRKQALQRFIANEKSLKRRGKLPEFEAVLREYVTLGHAEKVPKGQLNAQPAYYLPVQGVFKDTSTTTKCRAVFDASARTTTGYSLNDTLLTGPNFYPLLSDVLLKFRCFSIALSADISKMFREIWLHDDDKDLHRFFMREGDGRLMEYRMTRLTFGVKSSPYIATQVLRQVAEVQQSNYPLAAKAIQEDFYVDDFLGGADTLKEADTIRKQLTDLLSTAGMTIRKWRSNSTTLKDTIPQELKESEDLNLASPSLTKKALGVHWDSINDTIHVATPVDINHPKITKRVITSVTAKVFDVLGLFAPAIVPAKVLMQALWRKKLAWDKPVPDEVNKLWTSWISHLSRITHYSISRRVTTKDTPVVFKALHGFADASSVAYGVAIYLRQVHSDGQVSICLVTAKAKVLPLKEVTIPRAELLAARLLAIMLAHVAKLLEIPQANLFAWTDSAIVLHWIRTPPHRLQTFVSNRIQDITKTLPHNIWRHVRSKENPADLVSRGVYATELVGTKLWWTGPPWLGLSPEQWPPLLEVLVKNPPEVRSSCLTVVSPVPTFTQRFSSFFKLSRVTAWIRRFIKNARSTPEQRMLSSTLAGEEVDGAKVLLLNLAQRQEQLQVMEAVKQGKQIPRSHPLARFKLLVNEEGTLQVECRVRQQEGSPKRLTYLPIRNPITRLYLESLHREHGHPGTAALGAIVSDSYLIPGLRNFLKALSKKCTTCQKAHQRTLAYEMGLLPQERTQPSPPFSNVGVDFAGPLTMKSDKARKPTLTKVYVAVFICLSTKAVHLDISKGLSSEEFIATLRRFINRRGCPKTVFSDNGTNFVGAKREIREVQRCLEARDMKQAISQLGSSRGFTWKNIPPRAPHFGGLWEAAVRRMKNLLKKQLAPHPLMFDEIYTVLTEAEAILNSTPLIPLGTEEVVEDLSLTPGHFLVGRPMKALPSRPASQAKISSLRRWRLTERHTQDLWENWTKAYLQSLYHRTKWMKQTPNVKEDDIVFIKDESLPYRTWPLARIIKVYPGTDNVVRTVDLMCNGRILTRAVNRLIPCLMTPQDGEQNKPEAPECVQD